MKKRILGFACCLWAGFAAWCGMTAYASTDDYTAFSEIMMNEGKVLANYTDEEMTKLLEKVHKRKFMGVSIYEENKNVEASYISNTLYSVENSGEENIVYDIVVDVETSNKVSFNASGSLNASASGGKSGGVKGEIGAKCGIEFTETTTTSRKEKQTMKLTVEGGSRAIVYLTGNLSITNGVAAYYVAFIRVSEGGFEIVTLKNQYARVEKSKI